MITWKFLFIIITEIITWKIPLEVTKLWWKKDNRKIVTKIIMEKLGQTYLQKGLQKKYNKKIIT
jgi:hypothetical protein